MAHFDNSELQDYVRNGFIIEDPTHICSQVLPESQPKCRPGGIPILKRDHSTDSESSADFEVNVSCNLTELSISNKDSKDANKLKYGRVIYRPIKEINSGILELPEPKESPENVEQRSGPTLSELIAQNPITRRPFRQFARVNFSYNKLKAKHFSVIVPFMEPNENGSPYHLDVYIDPTVKVSDLIGLCGFLCYRDDKPLPTDEPNDYVLYPAENGMPEIDFPRISKYINVTQLCFTELALLKKSEAPELQSVTVVVYCVNGPTYEIEVESQDTPLEEIKKEAVKRKERDVPNEIDPEFLFSNEYMLELIDKPKEPLNLNLTVANVASTEFIMLRKNTARGNFVPRRLPRNHSSQALRQGSRVGTPATGGHSADLPGSADHFVFPNHSGALEEFAVERLHKIRPKWSATLTIHPDAIEITPVNIERRRTLVSHSTPKLTYLDFDAIANVTLSTERASHNRRHIKITWIWIPTEKMSEFYSLVKEMNHKISSGSFPSSKSSSVYTMNHDIKDERANSDSQSPIKKSDKISLLEKTKWKTLTLETKEDDAWNIVTKLNLILEARPSFIRQLYEQSHNTSRNPFESAQKIEKEVKKAFNSVTAPTTPITPTGKSRKKFTVNPLPMLSRMLSKQDQ
uniref:Stress-activated map kinase-interacting protein 1 n=2 Tax=Panagrolaimus sp. JU765 TaxID=591449 RepID=A0AC34RR59_9BILA